MDAPGHSTVEYDKVGKEYFENRQLKRGAAGWLLLVGLGVAYVSLETMRAGTSDLRKGAGVVFSWPRCSWPRCTLACALR